MWYRIQRLVFLLLSQASTMNDSGDKVEMLRRLLAESDNMVAQLQMENSKVCSVVVSCGGQGL